MYHSNDEMEKVLRDLSQKIRQPRREADLSISTNTEEKNAWGFTSIFLYILIVW
jgi:hypothetical protein